MRKYSAQPRKTTSYTPTFLRIQQKTRAPSDICQNTRDSSTSRLNYKPPVVMSNLYAQLQNRPQTSRPFAYTNRSLSPFTCSQTREFKRQFNEKYFSGSIDNYVLGRNIGQGAYATVRLASQKSTQNNVAVKIYDKVRLCDPRKKRNVEREVEILSKLDHPKIVKLIEGVETPRQVFIVMEYVNGIQLQRHLKRFPDRRIEERDACKIFRQVVQIIDYCHSQQIAHRDIKLDNILIDGCGQVKLIDFGFSTMDDPSKKIRLFCGTPSYMSPEIVSRKDFQPCPADIWALGVLLYALLTGTFPFRAANERELYRRIMRGQYEIPPSVRPEARLLIKRMMILDPEQRISTKEILEDPWCTSMR